mmetsp:Transcript_10531/g.22196  ORF Transcript_10531/g.22196 Transcript_10531/m.22196 type:complete len:227 (-) Transcript_10531:7-687(-)
MLLCLLLLVDLGLRPHLLEVAPGSRAAVHERLPALLRGPLDLLSHVIAELFLPRELLALPLDLLIRLLPLEAQCQRGELRFAAPPLLLLVLLQVPALGLGRLVQAQADPLRRKARPLVALPCLLCELLAAQEPLLWRLPVAKRSRAVAAIGLQAELPRRRDLGALGVLDGDLEGHTPSAEARAGREKHGHGGQHLLLDGRQGAFCRRVASHCAEGVGAGEQMGHVS